MKYMICYVMVFSMFIMFLSVMKETSGVLNLSEIQTIYNDNASLLFFLDKNSSFYSTYALSANSPDLLLRKTGHFFVYGFVAILIFVLLPKKSIIFRGAVSTITASIIGFVDEYHQYFLIGRSGLLQDVLINMIGSVVAICVLVLFLGVFALRRKLLDHYDPEQYERDIS